MITLTYGRKKPQTGDGGAAFFPALADNIVIDDAHTHDGSDSPLIPSSNLTGSNIDVTNSGWTADGSRYWKLVTFTGTNTFDNVNMRFFFDGGTYDGEELFPFLDKQSSTTFRLYMPMNDQAVTVLVR